MFQANRFRELRLKNNYTHQQLADALGVNFKQIWRWESGRDPGTDSVAKMAQLFGVSCDYLLGLSDVPNHPADLSDKENRLIFAYRSGDFQAIIKLLAGVKD